MDILETFGASSTANNSSAPPVTNATTPAPTTNVPTQPSPGEWGKIEISFVTETPRS